MKDRKPEKYIPMDLGEHSVRAATINGLHVPVRSVATGHMQIHEQNASPDNVTIDDDVLKHHVGVGFVKHAYGLLLARCHNKGVLALMESTGHS